MPVLCCFFVLETRGRGRSESLFLTLYILLSSGF
jgi:hypothetical protein